MLVSTDRVKFDGSVWRASSSERQHKKDWAQYLLI